MSSVITLVTDFGTGDEYVGVMKGVILSVNPSAVIVDVCHAVDAQDIRQAAYMIPAYAPYFPNGTVHVIVVDPGVGSARRILAAEIDGRYLLAPDNGVLTAMTEDPTNVRIHSVENADYFLKPVSRTFHGRDIFAPVAARLSMGLRPADLGPEVRPDDMARLNLPKSGVSERGVLTGEIIGVDRFGNLTTNIRSRHLREFGPDAASGIAIRVGSETISGLCDSYAAVGPENLLAIVGSRGYLEIAVNKGNARKRLHAGPGDAVSVIFEPET